MNSFKTTTLFIFALVSQAALAVSEGQLQEHVAGVLNRRADEVLKYRIAGLLNCKDNKVSEALAHHQVMPKTEKARLRSTLAMLKKTNIPECSEEITKSEQKLVSLQRKNLNIPFAAARSVCISLTGNQQKACENILKELDPFCATQNGPDLFGVKDPNPCMAGDRLLADVLRKPNDPDQEALNLFLSSLEERVLSSSKGDQIDLWNVYLEFEHDTPANRKNFISIVTFFYYALGTAGGYVDGIADFYWINSLKENNPDVVFSEYLALRKKADWYRTIIRGKNAQNRKFTITGIDIKNMNRHDFMSMFLSCHFKKYGNIIPKLLPNVLGVGYESLDFVSHLKTEVGFSRSIENFNTDTKRYRQGSAWGNSFCSTN